PIAQAQSVNTAEDTAVVITLSAIDADGDALTFSFTDPEHGPLRPVAPDLRLNQQRPLHASPDGSVELNVEYTPSTNYNGSDGFSFAVDDGTEMSESVAVSITVEPRNDPPSAISGLLITIKDTPVTVSLQGSDVDGDALVFSISQQPTNGTLGEIQPEDNTLAKVDYRPNAGFIGDDSIAFEVDDGNNGKQVGTIKITVKETNQPPEPNSQVVSVAVDTAEVIVLTGTDVDEDPLTFIVTRKPTNGSLSEPQLKNNSSAEVVYTPNSGFVGEDGFEFKVSDGLATSDVTVVTLEIGDNNLRESTIYLPLITLGN
ncbi:tandem-95 repeat protein, partial [Chloroflexi bacterium TSY]|nr:tandem-95 repeat protein [Chloroflexi bacterium TSY]